METSRKEGTDDIQEAKVGRLTFRYVAADCNRACYILGTSQAALPLQEWAVRYGWNVVEVGGMDWNNDLTPWPAPEIGTQGGEFGGHGHEFLQELRNEALPAVENALRLRNPKERLLMGVSLSALFAVWAWMKSDTFDHIASLSGSFWYDGFTDWLVNGGAVPKHGRAYFSLGDKECHAKNPRFRDIGEQTAQVVAALEKEGIATTFVRTAGTHFAPIAPRIEKAFEAIGKQQTASCGH